MTQTKSWMIKELKSYRIIDTVMACWLGLPNFNKVFQKVAEDLDLQTSGLSLLHSIIA